MSTDTKTQGLLAIAQSVITSEAQAVANLSEQLNADFIQACELLLACQGKLILTGMGKSGHVARKLAATLASTGSPAFYIHPGEASHGDLGMIDKNDCLIMLSNSGETQELINLLPVIKSLGITSVSMTSRPASTLAQTSDVHLSIGTIEEACPLGLAPTSSTTASMALGDALAVALMHSKGFTAADFAQSHPGGQLGRRLLSRVESLMRTEQAIPHVHKDASIAQALQEVNDKGLGFTLVTDENQQLVGLFTDGDLRRACLNAINLEDPINTVMSTACKTIDPQALSAEALHQMEEAKITALAVCDPQAKRLLGVVHLHDILRSGGLV